MLPHAELKTLTRKRRGKVKRYQVHISTKLTTEVIIQAESEQLARAAAKNIQVSENDWEIQDTQIETINPIDLPKE
jgi:hypothetical protein